MASSSFPLTDVGSGYTIVTQVIPTSGEPTAHRTQPRMQKFQQGEPRALGAVQIVNGIWMLAISLCTFTGHFPWGHVLNIIAGSLTVSASRKMNHCGVKAAMILNILSAISAGISIILLIWQLIWITPRYSSWTNPGLIILQLLFSLLQFAISISISAFACKATCSREPSMNVINMVPNPEGYIPVQNSFPVIPGDSTFNPVAMNHPPVDSPPAYTEMKDETEG